MGEGEVSLVSSISEADTIVGCSSLDLFYDKTIIINSDTFTKESLEELSKFNKIVSRFPLEADFQLEYDMEPYIADSRILDLIFDGTTRNVMSRLSLKSFVVTKSGGNYRIKIPQMFVNKVIKSQRTVIGLLSDQCNLSRKI